MNRVMKRMAEAAPRGKKVRTAGGFRRLGAIVGVAAGDSTRGDGKRPAKAPGLTQAELTELTEAMHEYEVNKGNWSKGR
jgi:hypothetical protein